MKKIGVLCFAMLLFGAINSNAQGLLDKIDRALDKADRASNSADRAGKTGSKFGGLFGKKKGAAEVSAESNTTISLTGGTFASVKSINENIQTCKGVAGSKMKFSAAGSTITVQHTGSTEDLLKALQKTNPAVFSEKNIGGLDDGEISVKLKK